MIFESTSKQVVSDVIVSFPHDCKLRPLLLVSHRAAFRQVVREGGIVLYHYATGLSCNFITNGQNSTTRKSDEVLIMAKFRLSRKLMREVMRNY